MSKQQRYYYTDGNTVAASTGQANNGHCLGGATMMDAGDAGVLAFGSSVSVNADLQRSLRTEIEEIELDCHKLRRVLGGVQNTQKELEKGRVHADNEMQSLHASSIQTLESIQFGQQLLKDLRSTVLHDFHDTVAKGSAEGGAGQVVTPKRPMDYLLQASAVAWQDQRTREAEVIEHRSFVQSRFREAEALAAELRELEASNRVSSSSLLALGVELKAKEAERDRSAAVLEQERQRQQSMDAMQRESSDKLVRGQEALAKKVARLRALRAQHEQKEKEMEQQFLKARHDNALLEQRLAVVRTERGHWNAQADQAQKRLNAVLELVRKRQEHKEDVESARAERQKLFAEKSQLEASLSAVQAEADRENRRLAAQEKAGEALRARIHETNTLVAKHYTDELKEELAEMIRQVQETKVLAAELEANNPELTKAEADLVSTRELLAQFKDVTQAALKELKSLKDHMEQRKQEFGRLRESTALLKEIRSKNTELQREIAALQEVEDVAVRQKKERKELEYTLRLYRAGVALLEETATKEKQIASSTNRPVDRALVTVGDTQSKMPIILEDSFQE